MPDVFDSDEKCFLSTNSLFIKVHVTLKTEIMAAEKSAYFYKIVIKFHIITVSVFSIK